MPNVRISDLPPAILPLTGAELLEITQNGLSYKVTSNELQQPLGLQADFVTLSANVDLPNERILTAGVGISIVDGGPGLDVTISSTAVPGGQVDSVVGGSNITVDATDPANPIVNLDDPVLANVSGNITGDVNGVTLSNAGPATAFLNQSGGYTVPPGVGGSLAGLSDVDLTGQAQYDLLFNVDGANWEDTAGNLIFDTAAFALQLGAGYALNMIDASVTSRRVAEIAVAGTPSVTIDHPSVQVVAEVSTTSNVEVAVTGAVLPLLNDGDVYLILAVAQHHQGNTGGQNIHGADIAIATGTGVPYGNCRDDIEPPSAVPGSATGQWFCGVTMITYSTAFDAQIQLEHSAGATATHYVNNAALIAINMTQFGTENVDFFRSVLAPFVTVTDAGWSNLSPTITIGDGVSDWLLFGAFQCDQPNVAAARIEFGLFDGAVNSTYVIHQFADLQDIKSVSFSVVLQGIAATTFQTAARAVAASTNTARIFTSSIIAIRLNRFAQYSITSAAGPTSPPGAAEFSLLTDSIVANSSSDWGILAFVRNQWIANTLSGTTYARANINAGGFTTLSGFSASSPQAIVENATVELTGKQMVPITDLSGVVATDTVGAELRWIPPATFGSALANVYNMVLFTWNTLDNSTEVFTVGDPVLDTQIDGLTINMFGAYSFPIADGTVGQVLRTDGAGQLSFVTVAAVPAGADSNIQYNNGGVFGGESNFTYNDLEKGITLTHDAAPGSGRPAVAITVNVAAPAMRFSTNQTGYSLMEVNANAGINVGFDLDLDFTGADPDHALRLTDQAGSFLQTWSRNGIVDISNSLLVVDTTAPAAVRISGAALLEMNERTVANAFVAGVGQFWVRDDAPNVPMFTNDVGTDFVLNAGGGSQTPWTSDIDGDGFNLTDAGVFFQREQATADVDVVGAGQIWTRTDAFSNSLMFTNDNGNDFEIATVNLTDMNTAAILVTGVGFVEALTFSPKINQNYMINAAFEVTSPAADDMNIEMVIDTNAVFKGILTYVGGGGSGTFALDSAVGEVITNIVLIPTDGTATPNGTYITIVGCLRMGATTGTHSVRAAKNADTGADGRVEATAALQASVLQIS